MRVMDLINTVKQAVNYTYYPNQFPATANDDCATVELTGGSPGNAQIARPSFQVLVRAKDPATAESKAWEIFNAFKLKRDFQVGSVKVIYCNAQNSTPLFIGTDENGRFLYSLNFSTITEV